MSVLDFNGGGSGNFWNYHDKNKEGFSTVITGDVVEIQTPQKRNFVTKQPETWPDGNPKLNIRLILAGQDGSELAWEFSPGGSQNPTNAMRAVQNALLSAGLPGNSVTEIGGLNITIGTQEGAYSQQNPRPWSIQVNAQGSHQYRGVVKNQPQQAQQAPVQQAPVQPVQPIQQVQQVQPQPQGYVDPYGPELDGIL